MKVMLMVRMGDDTVDHEDDDNCVNFERIRQEMQSVTMR